MQLSPDTQIAVVGLGYVGLPLAVSLSHFHKVAGYDCSQEKIAQLQRGAAPYSDLSPEELAKAKDLQFSSNPEIMQTADIIIVCTPTPVDEVGTPNFSAMRTATTQIGCHFKKKRHRSV